MKDLKDGRHILDAIRLMQIHKKPIRIPKWYKVLDFVSAILIFSFVMYIYLNIAEWLFGGK